MMITGQESDVIGLRNMGPWGVSKGSELSGQELRYCIRNGGRIEGEQVQKFFF